MVRRIALISEAICETCDARIIADDHAVSHCSLRWYAKPRYVSLHHSSARACHERFGKKFRTCCPCDPRPSQVTPRSVRRHFFGAKQQLLSSSNSGHDSDQTEKYSEHPKRSRSRKGRTIRGPSPSGISTASFLFQCTTSRKRLILATLFTRTSFLPSQNMPDGQGKNLEISVGGVDASRLVLLKCGSPPDTGKFSKCLGPS